MSFEKIVPEWLAKGAEPPKSLKESGFTAGYKPPADYFNWFWHAVSEALAELQGMKPEDIGAAPENMDARNYQVGTAEELDALLGQLLSETPKDTVKRFEVGFTANVQPLGGGTYMGQLYKVSNNYAFVEMAVYATDHPRIWVRSLFAGEWKNWTYLATASDVTTKIGAITAKQVGAIIDRQDGYSASMNDIVDNAVYRVAPSATDTPYSGIAGVCFHKTWDAHFAVQLFFTTQDKMYRRAKLSGTWTKWALVYDDTNKPTPEDISAAPKDSPVFTGSVSMGRKAESNTGNLSAAFGKDVEASGMRSFAVGFRTKAAGADAFAGGSDTIASGDYSHAEGWCSQATGSTSYASGWETIANNSCSHAIGRRNKEMALSDNEWASNGDAFVIGNGTSGSRSNALRVTFAGATYGLAAFNASGADYAEFFEWMDGNTEAEDRIGYFVTLDGNKIRKAKAGEYILGVVSGNPCIVGNSDEDWLNRWEKDEFGRFIKEEVISKDEETGEVIVGWKYKQNPNYDNTQAYVERKDRPEWDYVGMLGIVAVRDDGTCQVNGFCKVADDGTATAADGYVAGQTYRVVGRETDNIVKVVFR